VVSTVFHRFLQLEVTLKRLLPARAAAGGSGYGLVRLPAANGGIRAFVNTPDLSGNTWFSSLLCPVKLLLLRRRPLPRCADWRYTRFNEPRVCYRGQPQWQLLSGLSHDLRLLQNEFTWLTVVDFLVMGLSFLKSSLCFRIEFIIWLFLTINYCCNNAFKPFCLGNAFNLVEASSERQCYKAYGI
jgi:hypothetical protein